MTWSWILRIFSVSKISLEFFWCLGCVCGLVTCHAEEQKWDKYKDTWISYLYKIINVRVSCQQPFHRLVKQMKKAAQEVLLPDSDFEHKGHSTYQVSHIHVCLGKQKSKSVISHILKRKSFWQGPLVKWRWPCSVGNACRAGGILRLQDCNSGKPEDYISSVIKNLQCICGGRHWSSMDTHAEAVVASKTCERRRALHGKQIL